MLYDKLPIVMVSSFLSEKEDSTNAVITRYILEHLNDLQDISIKQLAKDCNVGTGSISRYCRDIGLSDFAELKELIISADRSPVTLKPKETPEERISEWTDSVIASLRMVERSISVPQIHKLCRDIQIYEKVSTFGMLKAQAAATDLQTDMLMCGKHIYSCTAYADQISHILKAGKDELIIIFSYTGSYFDYQNFRAKEKHLVLPKIWMICGSERKQPWFVNEQITFESLQDHDSHPFQLEAVESLIAREYRELTADLNA